MKNKKILFGISLTLVICFIFGITLLNKVSAAEIIKSDWIVNSGANDLIVTDESDGGVATVSYNTVPSDSTLNSVTLKITNYDIIDNQLSIKYKSDFPVTGSNITIEISYSSGSDENTGEDYEGGKVLTGWFENWNVESGKTRDGYDLITMDLSSYTSGKTINGIIFTFSYVGDVSVKKTINFLGVDLHIPGVTPQFVTDGEIAEGSIYLGLWEADDEAGNIEYTTSENGDTLIHYSSAPDGKSRIVAPLHGHDLTLLPTLRIKYSCTKSFNLAVYINGTSTSLMSYTDITDNEGELSFDLSKTMEKLCIIVDREKYCDKSTYPSSDPTKDVYLQFYFVTQEGKEIKVTSVPNNGYISDSNGGSESGGESGSTTPNPPVVGNVSIGEFTDKKGEAGNLEVSKNEQGQYVFYFSGEPTGKSRVYADVTGHSYSAYPILQVTYSCTKEFNLAIYINGTSDSLLYYTNFTNNEGVLTLDLIEFGTVDEIVIMVDRDGKHNSDTYTDEDPTKTVYLKFDFLTS